MTAEGTTPAGTLEAPPAKAAAGIIVAGHDGSTDMLCLRPMTRRRPGR